MTAERLTTTKVTELTLMLARKLAKQTGEKQYRILERLVNAEFQRLSGKRKTR